MIEDILNNFVNAEVPNNNKRIIIKILGRLVNMLIELNYNKYSPYI